MSSGRRRPTRRSLTRSSVPFLVLRTVGTTSLPQTVKLTNVGGGELDITGITVTGRDLTLKTSPSPTTALPLWHRAGAASLRSRLRLRLRVCAQPRS
jgi:hypothetical protein